ncbi:MAG: TolC family protein [Vicinamibacterales bacterium]
MRHSIQRGLAAAAVLTAALTAAPSFAQTAPVGPVRRLSVDDAVRLALEQNLGIQIDRLTPQIEDIAVAQARTFWVPNATVGLTNASQDTPATSVLSGGQSKIADSRFTSSLGVNQILRTGANYSVDWSSYRATSTNVFTSYNPLLNSNLVLSLTQPLLRNRTVDSYRQQLESTRKDRSAADVQLNATIQATTRNVKNAYWELAYQIDNLKAQQQSLDLAKRLLADNEKRVQIGTMAPIDIVEAQSEVARNEESVIVAEAGIKQAEDRLRALVFNPATTDFWTQTIEPTETMPFVPLAVDAEVAVRRALARRTDVQLAKNDLEKSDITIRYYKNQTLPDVNARATFQSSAAGGTQLTPLTSILGTDTPRSILSQHGFGAVLGDVLTSAYPAWTIGVTVSYPIGTSTSETSLARAQLQKTQSEVRLQNTELMIATQVRDAARQVQTNQKRVDSARAARELAERRLDAEQKKFAAGIQISFFVFQAQRDLSQARTNEIRAIADYNKSRVDFEAVQETPLR